MSGDYSRFTHRPRKGYSGVLMQQGRVQLDADWNEEIAIVKRRWEIQARDTFGLAAVPRKTTKQAFLIAWNKTESRLDIGPGRMYVHGLLAERFFGEPGHPVHYGDQPFFPLRKEDALPTGGEAIVYLDVWEREVTWVEDPGLLEPALGGPDTTTRLQTVWQVKVEPMDKPVCGVDLDSLFPPSAGRLSTRANQPPAPDDPCVLPPGGGYRGLENRLYRVEIHDGGGLGKATFKWSRDNASVVSPVTAIDGKKITVQRLGRDKVLRFATDDWVEVTDDVRELHGEPGVMARVVIPDEATLTLELDRDLSGAGFDPKAEPSRHVRVRRWDQGKKADATTGLLTTDPGGAWVDLGDGVEVRIGVAGGGELKTGDSWVFAARAIDGSVEILDEASPRGIVHYYVQLATWTDIGGANHLGDCRPLWPEEEPEESAGCCCCTVTVGDGVHSHGDYDNLLQAVAAVSKEERFVEVCVLPGEHVLSDTVVIAHDDVAIRGCGPSSVVKAPSTKAAFELSGGSCTLERLHIEAGAAPAVRLQGRDLAVVHNVLTSTATRVETGLIEVKDNTSGVRILENLLQDAKGHGITLGGGDDIVIAGNRIRRLQGSGIATPVPGATGGEPALVDELRIEGNEIVDCIRDDTWLRGGKRPHGGIVLDRVSHVEILGNRIAGNGAAQTTSPVAGIEVRNCKGLIVRGNTIVDNGAPPDGGPIPGRQGGILAELLSVHLEEVDVIPGGTTKLAPLQPDGWPAAAVQDNLVVAPRGLALLLNGVGPMMVTGNRLTSRDVLLGAQGVDLLASLFGTVLIVNFGAPAYALRQILPFGFLAFDLGDLEELSRPLQTLLDILTVSGKVEFSNNQVALDLVRGEIDVALAAVGLFTLDDLACQNNQTECTLFLDGLLVDTFCFGTTVRATGNGLTESLALAFISLWAAGLVFCTGTSNQGTHCIIIESRNQMREGFNLSLRCDERFGGLRLFKDRPRDFAYNQGFNFQRSSASPEQVALTMSNVLAVAEAGRFEYFTQLLQESEKDAADLRFKKTFQAGMGAAGAARFERRARGAERLGNFYRANLQAMNAVRKQPADNQAPPEAKTSVSSQSEPAGEAQKTSGSQPKKTAKPRTRGKKE